MRPAKRKCLQLYYYFMDRQLGLIHVKLQTWFPFPDPGLCERPRVARAPTRPPRAEVPKATTPFCRSSDPCARRDWPTALPASTGCVSSAATPERSIRSCASLLSPMQYYWVTSQAEYSTDVLFRSRADLEELMPRLLQYSTLYFEARDVMAFLGRKLNGNFQGDLVTDQLDFSQLPRRLPGRRVKHRMKRNWIKMYNKEGSVLRVETVINQPDEFQHPQARAPPGKARHGVGTDEKGRRVPPALPPDLRADQRALPRRVGSRR